MRRRAESDNQWPNVYARSFSPGFLVFGDICMEHSDPRQSVGGDAELFAAAQTGSNAALGKLLEESRNYLLLIANRQLGEGVRAKLGASDLVQETFAEALQIFDRFEGKSYQELRAWLVRILEFKIAQATRRFAGTEKRDMRREISLETLSRDEWPQKPDRLGIAIGRAGGKACGAANSPRAIAAGLSAGDRGKKLRTAAFCRAGSETRSVRRGGPQTLASRGRPVKKRTGSKRS